MDEPGVVKSKLVSFFDVVVTDSFGSNPADIAST